MKGSIDEAVRLYRSKRYDQALRHLLALDIDPADSPEVSYYLGLCYTRLKQYDEALLYLEQVVTNHANLLHIYQSRMILSLIYAMTRRYRLAKFELDQLVEGGYESTQVFSAYGYVLYQLKQPEESLAMLQKALSLDPDNANALNSLGYIMAEEGLDTATAVNYCREAVKQKPESYAYLDSLGWACMKAGKLEEARGYLRRAMELSGGDNLVAQHMRAVLDEIETNPPG
jgi:tetratricopeptide (TPR) repeat protein